jgi:uncharacterized membrane protein (UPF0127 family)
MRSAWLLRDGQVLASAEVADQPADRIRGLVGRASYDGAMVLPGFRVAHTLFMQFPVDVAYVNRDMTVLAICTMSPWRVGLPRWNGQSVVQAAAGSFERWGLRAGDRLEIRDVE